MSLLDDIATRGAQFRMRARQLAERHTYSTNTKSVMLVAYVDLALEHHAAIWLLRERELFGSAFALVRAVYGIMLRALWIGAKATDEQIEQASRDNLDWRRIRLLDDIKEAYFGPRALEDAELAKLADRFFQYLRDLMRVLHSYTHPGARQLGRRFIGDQVKPSYMEWEIAQALNLATMVLMFLMQGFFVIMASQPDAEEIRTLLMQYFADFNERLNKGK